MLSHWLTRQNVSDRLTQEAFVKAYFSYPTIPVYFVLGLIFSGVSIYLDGSPAALGISFCGAVFIYPIVEYVLHRFVLHAKFLYKIPWTARLWKRVHFDHHQNPNDPTVIFAALYTTLPTNFIITVPLAWWIPGGPGGAAAGFAVGLFCICFYELCHCLQHFNYVPKSHYFRKIKKLHLAHHFHNERGNFGITGFVVDKLVGTYYPGPDSVPRSPTVFNLGYRDEEMERFPWVAELSGLKEDPLSRNTGSH